MWARITLEGYATGSRVARGAVTVSAPGLVPCLLTGLNDVSFSTRSSRPGCFPGGARRVSSEGTRGPCPPSPKPPPDTMAHPAWSVPWTIDAAAHSVVGNVRDHNEDSAHVESGFGLFAVADGLGGHRAGEHASSLAVEVLGFTMQRAHDEGAPPELELLLEAFDQANMGILEDAAKPPQRQGMGTTLTALLIHADGIYIGHVGDSRAWRVRDGRMEQLTLDHTVVAEQVREGMLPPADAEEHPMRHVLSRCLGVREELSVDLVEADVSPDDAFLLATDGLWGGLEPDEIQEILTKYSDDAGIACQTLVERACELDGRDNITAVVVFCREA